MRPRPQLLALVAVLLACANRPEVEAAPATGADATVDGPSATATQAHGQPPSRGDGRRPIVPVAVVAVDFGETRPCEQVCGRVGDCLITGGEAPMAATNLELECLDLCVHAPVGAEAREPFLACGQHQACGELTSCATTHWTALRGSRQGPEYSGVDVAQDACRLGCSWLYHCLFTGAPPGEGQLEQGLQENLETCQNQCDEIGPGEVEHLSKMYECLSQGQCQDPYACMR